MPTIKSDCTILTTKIATLDEKALMQGKLLKGRQLVWLIFDHFRLNADMKLVYDIEDITALEYPGDAQIHSFWRLWFMMVAECETTLGEKALRNILYRQLKKSTELVQDLAYYDRQPEGHEHKMYQYLIKIMERMMERRQEEKNQDDWKKGINKAGNQNALAAAGGKRGKGPTSGW